MTKLKKFRVTCYPSYEKYVTIVEADSKIEAQKIAEEDARNNCGFYADEVEEL